MIYDITTLLLRQTHNMRSLHSSVLVLQYIPHILCIYNNSDDVLLQLVVTAKCKIY